MIRHITTKNNFEKIKKSGEIVNPNIYNARPRNERDRVSFEQYNNNDIFVYILGKMKQKLYQNNDDIVVMYIDENDLSKLDVVVTTAGINNNKECGSKIECSLFFEEGQENELYKQIGEYVHVSGPISYELVKDVKVFDNEKLNKIKNDNPGLNQIDSRI